MGLGRGLSALLGDEAAPNTAAARQGGGAGNDGTVPIEFLRPNRYQPRTHFDAEMIEDLASSIREKGILQPILVRPVPGERDAYEIIAGERRWRAAQAARLHDVPVIIRTLSDSETLEVALIENIQREDLNAIEEALAYRRLQREFGYTQDQLSDAVGKSRSHVANLMRLLDLPAAVQEMVAEGQLSMGHARALVTAAEPVTLAKLVVAKGLNVRQTERLVQHAPETKSAKPKPAKDVNTAELERNLSSALGLAVSITDKGAKGGEVRISYKTLDQLDEVCRRLCQIPDGER
jgi:ParB family transcriptional regulator, chromosome partitioning protein